MLTEQWGVSKEGVPGYDLGFTSANSMEDRKKGRAQFMARASILPRFYLLEVAVVV